MARPLIALDADGVLLDFHLGYAGAWARAFGSRPAERDPLAYWPIDRWEVDRLDEERRLHFRRHFDETVLVVGAGHRGRPRRLPPPP